MRHKISYVSSTSARIQMALGIGTVVFFIADDLIKRWGHAVTPGTPWRFLWLFPFYYLLYKLVLHVTKEKISIQYDETQVYIFDHKQASEIQVPLENVVKLNMRRGSVRTGARWRWKYSLHYIDAFGQLVNVSFLVSNSNTYFEDFKKRVKEKNPAFTEKNWTHSFDWKDN